MNCRFVRGIIDSLPRNGPPTEPIVESKAASFIARRAAIDIAEACKVLELQTLLADIALDTSETVD